MADKKRRLKELIL